jgi:septum formation protein
MAEPRVILASGSPRRRELLAQIGIDCLVRPVDLDESQLPGESPRDYVERLAREKALAGLAASDGSLPAIGSDTAVVLDGDTLGKPRDRADGLATLARLSGRAHSVLSGVAVATAQQCRSEVVETKVFFRALSDAEIQAYWDTGEPADKAGSYGIQGRGAVFVERIEGCYSNVVGLPLAATARLLGEFGVSSL